MMPRNACSSLFAIVLAFAATLTTTGIAFAQQLPTPPNNGTAAQTPSTTQTSAANTPNCDSFVPAGGAVSKGVGDTLVSYTHMPDGTMAGVAVYRSSGDTALDKAAIDCANATRWPPTVVEGKLSEITAVGSVSWTLQHHFFSDLAMYGPREPCNQRTVHRHAVRLDNPGTTIAAYHITADGTVKDVTVKQSSGVALLDDAVISCVSSWRFYPIRQHGLPFQLEREINVRWGLK